MKIEIEIDIESIVRDEIRNYVRENIVINNVVGTETPKAISAIQGDSVVVNVTEKDLDVPTWEYAPKLGRRRNKTEIALHEKELELGRNLTPEEKGQIDAGVELDSEKEAKAKEDAKKKARIDEIAEEATEAAARELAEEAEFKDAMIASIDVDPPSDVDEVTDTLMPGESEETIPETEEIKTDSLFS